MKDIPSVYIIILQYNHSDRTINCLDSLKKITYANAKFVVVDNASDGNHMNTVRLYISNEFGRTRKCKFIINGKNLGYGGGNNTGIGYALENGADYVLILNNDTTVSKDFVEPLVEAIQSDPKIGIVQSVIVEDGTPYYGAGPIEWFNIRQELMSHRPEGGIIPDGAYATGSSMLVKKEVFEKVGMLDGSYFLYYDDADFSFMVRNAGYDIIVAEKSRVEHGLSASTSSLGVPLLLYYHYRNLLLFADRFAPAKIKIAMPFWATLVYIKQMFKFLIRKDVPESRAIRAGIMDYYKKQFGKYEKDRN